MKQTLRKYHRMIAIIFGLPLFFMALTGVGAAIADTWLHQEELAAWLITLHTYHILKLDAILPIVNGISLIGLVVTGLSMTGLWSKRRQPVIRGDRS